MPINEIKNNSMMYNLISKQLEEKSSIESMNNMLINTKKLINALKYIPLYFKAFAAKAIYGFLGDKIFSTTLSNVGIITIPKDLEKCIESIDIILGQSLSNRANCSLVTYNNISTLTITKMTKDPSFEENLYKFLIDDGNIIDVEGSPLYED